MTDLDYICDAGGDVLEQTRQSRFEYLSSNYKFKDEESVVSGKLGHDL